MKTRNIQGALKMADRGQKLPLWMMHMHSLDPLGTWQRIRRNEARKLIGIGYGSKTRIFNEFLKPNI
jgi:hypothetical protein